MNDAVRTPGLRQIAEPDAAWEAAERTPPEPGRVTSRVLPVPPKPTTETRRAPFFRSPDESTLGQEVDYVPPVQSNSESQASLSLNFVLSQDAYGSNTALSLPSNDFPVPGLAVGRLVETATEIGGVIDAYEQTFARRCEPWGRDPLQQSAHLWCARAPNGCRCLPSISSTF